MTLVLHACALGNPSRVTPEIDTAAPEITGATVECSAEKRKWTFEVDTARWTGGGQVVMTVDGQYAEKHPLPSTAAAGDGTTDHLGDSLAIEADWRDAAAGSATYFNCDEPNLHGMLRVFSRDGETQADCRVFAGSPGDWARWGDLAVECDRELDAGDSG
jgi:hypothetical protein